MIETHIQIIGFLFTILALVHVIFPRYFSWKVELAPLSLINRQMFQIHTLFVALTVFLMGLLCILYSEELTHNELGKPILFGFAVFWSLRFVIQFFGYSSKLWRGKKFETVVHIVFSGFWMYTTVVFWMAFLKFY